MAYAYFLPLLMQMMESQGGQNNQDSAQNNFSVPFGNSNSPFNYYDGGNHPGMLGSGVGLGASGGSSPMSGFMSGLGSGIGGSSWFQGQTPAGRMSNIGNGIFNMFFAKNPSDAARPDLQAIEGSMGKYMQPFIGAGLSALPTLQDQYSQLTNNPGAVMNKIGSGFQQSPGYQFQVDQATNAANRAAAAGGMLGSPMEQQNLASTVTGLANQDYGNYMNRALGMYGQGLGGLSNLYGTGFNASGMMSQGMLQALMAMAQNDYAGANTYNQQMGGGISSLIGGLF